jgi:hypothetical protein
MPWSFQRCALVAACALLAAAPLAGAERTGGIRQAPLIPPSGMKSGSISTAPSSRPGDTEPSGTSPADIRELPDSVVITHRGTRYVVSAGRWYRQRGDKLRAISPPQGVLVQELPQGYSMRWVGGVPYFYADGLYYIWRERKRSYEVLPTAPAGDMGQHSDAPAPPRPEGGQGRDPTP